MSRVRRRAPKARRLGISIEERVALLGEEPPPEANPFALMEFEYGGRAGAKLREAWEYAGESLLAEWIQTHSGTRPPGWWRFDAPEPRPEDETEASCLERLGLLHEGEVGSGRPSQHGGDGRPSPLRNSNLVIGWIGWRGFG